jgi:hypothetical protein
MRHVLRAALFGVLVVGCQGQQQDSSPWVLWGQGFNASAGYIGKWMTIRPVNGQKACEDAKLQLGSGGPDGSSGNLKWVYACWPAGTTPQ